MTVGMQNVTTACPKDKMELNFFYPFFVPFTKTILKVLRSSSIGEWRESKMKEMPVFFLIGVTSLLCRRLLIWSASSKEYSITTPSFRKRSYLVTVENVTWEGIAVVDLRHRVALVLSLHSVGN